MSDDDRKWDGDRSRGSDREPAVLHIGDHGDQEPATPQPPKSTSVQPAESGEFQPGFGSEFVPSESTALRGSADSKPTTEAAHPLRQLSNVSGFSRSSGAWSVMSEDRESKTSEVKSGASTPLPSPTHSPVSSITGGIIHASSTPHDEARPRPISIQKSPQVSIRSGSVGSAGSYRLGHPKQTPTLGRRPTSTISPTSSQENIEVKTTPDEEHSPAKHQPVTVQLSSGKTAEITPVSEDDLGNSFPQNVRDSMHTVGRDSLPTVKELDDEPSTATLNVAWQSVDTDDVSDETFFPSLNPMYATVTSNVSAFSHESSDMAYCPDLPGGIIRFVQDGDSIMNQKDHYYVCAQRDCTVNDVANYIAGGWRRRTPKIVLSIISSGKYFNPWENERSVDNFKRGIIQAANLTEMWILTDGVDTGVTKMIGDAAYQEMARRQCQVTDAQVIKNVYMVEKVTKLTVLGVVNKKQIAYSDKLTGEHREPQHLENTGNKPSSGKFDLNPNHTHFILAEDVEPQELTNFRYNLELRCQLPVGRPRRYRRMPSSQTTLLMGSEMDLVQTQPTVEGACTPVIGLLIQGGPLDIDHTLALLKKKIPVIVMKGFGKAADLVAFAYEAMMERSDEDYVNMYIKPELMKKVTVAFPKYFKNNDLARNLCRDEILECATIAHQDGLTYLTVIDTTSKESDLTNLNKYILTALFKAQTRKLGIRWREQIQRDLQLTLDWNCPDLADSEIFTKYNWIRIKVEDHVFHQALVRPNRWEFVKLFLKKGFKVHRYLNHKRLHNLFENALDKEFFIGVCLEGVLGKSVDPYAPLERDFIETDSCDLNRILYRCTRLSKLINPYTLSMNSLGTYVTDKEVAERRAVNTLVLWAALTNRPELAKVFWWKTEDPMAVSLIVSMLMHNLAKNWCKEADVRDKVQEIAVEFGQMAVSLLDLCYKDSSNQAFKALDKKLPDFNDKTVVEIASIGKNKWFIAHPCCQKWLSRRWYGNLKIRELDWAGPKLPDWLKIYLSVFLLFPMFVWVYFEPKEKGKQQFETEDDEDEEELAEDAMLLRPLSIDASTRRKKSFVAKKIRNLIARDKIGLQLPVWKQIFYLWNAPITKFWMNQLFYVFYLILFSVAVLVPNCGELYLNISVLVWTAVMWAELVRGTLVKKSKYPEVPIFWKFIEILAILMFLLMFLVVRILPHFVQYVDYMTTKFLMSVGLLLFYYRTLAVFLPMSPTLGPMLIGINKMVRKDFTTWMRMFLIVMVAGGITIHAVLYPNYPLTQEGIRRAFARAFFAMFLTKIDDLDGDESCSHLYKNASEGSCQAHPLLAKCPYSSLGGYVIVIQYLVITKLVLVTLLYAMFSATTAKIKGEAEEIWKYQRYTIIVDFEARLRLPPPLTLISYLCMLLQTIWRQLVRLFHRCWACCKCTKKDFTDGGGKKIQIMKVRRTVDFNYWKSCVKLYSKQEEQKEAEKNRAQDQSDCLSLLVNDVKQQQENQTKMNDRVVHVEKSVMACRLLLEEMKHMLQNLDPKSQGLKPTRQLIHVASRQSPYPGTRTQRFPVFDKYVSWEVEYGMYDPTYLTKPAEEFSPEHLAFVDPDIIELKKEVESRQKMSPEELEKLPPLKEFNPVWNSEVEVQLDGEVIEVDRTSWILINGEQLRYKLDKAGLPQNPLGRTGIRGRGNLWRWGPNHRISAIITRWKRKYSHLGFPSDYFKIEGKKVLEFICVPKPDTGELTLPGGNVYGRTCSYSVMCEQFLKYVLMQDFEENPEFGSEDMKRFFSQFAATSSGNITYQIFGMNAAAKGFSAQVVYQGYIDDPSNTDNAWREAEVWSFHYALNDIFDEKIPDHENLWKEVSSYTRLYGNQDSIVQEVARIHDSYF